MKKLKLNIAASIDGFIARSDGDIDWLMEFPNPSKEKQGNKEFSESVDTLIMGGRTYYDFLCRDIIMPYKEKKTYVVSRNPLDDKGDIHFITENIIETVSKLKEENGKDIWLVGGGELIGILLNEGLIDEMTITYIPVILGKGISLFPNIKETESNWKFIESKTFANGAVKLSYRKAD